MKSVDYNYVENFHFFEVIRLTTRRRLILATIILIILSLTTQTFAANNYEYIYDKNNRLIQVKKEGTIIFEYIYDNNGNLLKAIPGWVPTSLTATNVTDTSFTLTWVGNNKATSYYVYKQNSNSSIISQIGTSKTSSFQVTGLKALTEYTFYVRSFNENTGEISDYSQGLMVKTQKPNSNNYEPNNSLETAYSIKTSLMGDTYYSYIQSLGDVDYYRVDVSIAGDFLFSLKVPDQLNYDLYLYRSTGSLINSSNNSGSISESIRTNLSTGTYYLKVIGYQGHFSPSLYYELTASQLTFELPDDFPDPCPKWQICLDPPPIEPYGEVMEKTDLQTLTGEQISTLGLINNEEIDQRMKAYSLLAEIGLLGDLEWLYKRLYEDLSLEEQKQIITTISKIGFKHQNHDKEKALYYLSLLLNYSYDTRIHEWLKEKLLEIYRDPKKVEKLFEK